MCVCEPHKGLAGTGIRDPILHDWFRKTLFRVIAEIGEAQLNGDLLSLFGGTHLILPVRHAT